jgi:hypothetical protein
MNFRRDVARGIEFHLRPAFVRQMSKRRSNCLVTQHWVVNAGVAHLGAKVT